jgi:hypothetical protein
MYVGQTWPLKRSGQTSTHVESVNDRHPRLITLWLSAADVANRTTIAVEDRRWLREPMRTSSRLFVRQKTNNNRQQWRCSACLNGNRVPKGPKTTPGVAPITHSAVRDIFRPNARKSLNVIPSGIPKDTPLATNTSIQTFEHVPNEAVNNKSRVGVTESADTNLSELPLTKLSEPPEVTNMPTHYSSRLGTPDTTFNRQIQHAPQNFVNQDSANEPQPQSVKSTPLHSLCSICREQWATTRDEKESFEW